MRPEKVSIVIPTRNREFYLFQCLKALFEQDYNGIFEIVVINDGHPLSSNIWELVKAEKRILTKIVEIDKRVGIAGARNIGIEKSEGEIIAFLDDDSIPLKNWLKNIVRAYRYGNEIGGIGGRIISSLKDLDSYSLTQVVGTITMFGHVVFNFNSLRRTYVEWVRGCNMSFRRDVLRLVRGFDEKLDPISESEDIDICLRVRKSGYNIVFEPKAVVIHTSASTGGIRTKPCEAAYWNIRNTTYIYFRNLNSPLKFIAILRCLLGTLLLYLQRSGKARIIISSTQGLFNGLKLALISG